MPTRTRDEKPPADADTTIISAGGARLIKTFSGKYFVIGGSPADVAEIRKWTDQFLPDQTIEVRKQAIRSPDA